MVDPKPPEATRRDVKEAFEWLRHCRRTGSYGAMGPHIHSSARDGIVDLLVAVDELMLANAAALSAMQQACPGIDVRPYDLQLIQNKLELFSRDVELVGVRQDGDSASVTVQIANQLPLVRLRFERHDGTWQYLPGAEDPNITQAIRQRTKKLRQIELVLSHSRLDPRQVDREYHIRMGARREQLWGFAEAKSAQNTTLKVNAAAD
jgi:hypothetical protein